VKIIDEHDNRVKKNKDIFLLEGVMYLGKAVVGSCDYSCFIFWRVEWLEKIEMN